VNNKFRKIIFFIILTISYSRWALAAPEFKIEIKNHLFFPAELIVPSNTKIKLRIFNLDSTPEEFESYELNREKVIMGNSQTVIFIGPLKPGEYPYFGEFNPKTAQGIIFAQ